MTKVVQIHEYGGPEVLKWEDADVANPGSGQALIRQTAVGLNFVDTYHRTKWSNSFTSLPSGVA